MRKRAVREIIEVGRFLFEAGVVDYFAGNLSIRDGKFIHITRSGSPLPMLTERDVLSVPFKGVSLKDLNRKGERFFVGKPSSEFIVHRAVYKKTDARAVAHAHPPTVVRLAFELEDVYEPRDSEARLLLGKVPIVEVARPSASPELAEAVSEALKGCNCVIVRSHGVFCKGKTLREAAGFITALEFSAKVYG